MLTREALTCTVDYATGGGLGSGMIHINGGEPIPSAVETDSAAGNLTKAHLIDEVSRVAEIPQYVAAAIVERILDSMVRALARGEKVEIRGFGSLGIRERQARIARNPKTGTQVKVPVKKIVFFRPGKVLLGLVNKK